MTTAPELELTARALVADGKGILAADESDGTIKKRFDSIGVESTEDNRRAYRDLLFTTTGVEEYISGVILFDETIRQSALDGTPFPKLLESKGIIPGIKVDQGAKPLALARRARRSPKGSTGCASGSRSTAASARASRSGARRYSIGDDLPSEYCVWTNAHALARYAALCQEAGIVPIVEPEVLQDGTHTIERATTSTCARARSAVYTELHDQRVDSAGRCSSRTWCSPATRRPTARASTRSPSGRSSASTGTCRPRCPGSSSSRAASRTRTRPRTSTR